ncbi:NAD(P)-dependent oxidoreductase [Endozoicomonas sp. Mp262]|uniref:SDR family oxidoreductase n=1 Tax=Endozoicomonas sp. Mp262 TaxID=2919499 RepID=UPI0021DA19F6
MKVLVIGSTGKTGHELCMLLKEKNIPYDAPGRKELDLAYPEQIQSCLKHYKPDIVVNAASYNNPGQAEIEPAYCFRINKDAVAEIADYCNRQGCILIQVSTYRIFDGIQSEPYSEQDTPNPSNVQAISRWQAEQEIHKRCARHIILRLSWVISERRNNMLAKLLDQLSCHQEVTVTSDQLGCPTPAEDAARVIIAIIQQLDCGADVWGTYHYASTEAVSENSFAEIVTLEASHYHHLKVKKLKMNKMDNRKGVLPPANANLDCSLILNTFGIHRRPWRTALSKIIYSYFQNTPFS